KFYDVTSFASNLFNLDQVVCGNAELLATSLNDCEHLFSFRVVRSSSHPCNASGSGTGRLFISRLILEAFQPPDQSPENRKSPIKTISAGYPTHKVRCL